MSHKRLEKLDPERRQRLFESAAEEFSANGFESASLNRILDQSGMSKSSLYYYFHDKADLFTTMLEHSMAFLFREIGGFDPTTLTAESFWVEIEILYRRAVIVTNRNAWYIKLGRIFYRLRGNPNAGAPTARTVLAARNWIGKIVAHGQQLGVVRTDLPDSLLIDSVMGLGEAVDRWIVDHWEDMTETERLGMVGGQIDLFRRILAVPPP